MFLFTLSVHCTLLGGQDFADFFPQNLVESCADTSNIMFHAFHALIHPHPSCHIKRSFSNVWLLQFYSQHSCSIFICHVTWCRAPQRFHKMHHGCPMNFMCFTLICWLTFLEKLYFLWIRRELCLQTVQTYRAWLAIECPCVYIVYIMNQTNLIFRDYENTE